MTWNNLPNGTTGGSLPLYEIKRVIICKPSVTFASLTALYNVQSWKTYIQTANPTMFVTGSAMGYENTTDDVAMQTALFGQKLITNVPPPSLTFMLDSNWADYGEMLLNLKGGNYTVIYELKNGEFLLRKMNDGTYQGFPANIQAASKVLASPGDVMSSYKIYVFHRDFEHFKDAFIMAPEWEYDELLLAMPVGLDMTLNTAYATDTVVVDVKLRSTGAAYAGLLLADFKVVDSNYLISPTVTAFVDNADGTYDLTVMSGAVPAALAVGAYVVVQAQQLSSTVVTHISNRFKVVGA